MFKTRLHLWFKTGGCDHEIEIDPCLFNVALLVYVRLHGVRTRRPGTATCLPQAGAGSAADEYRCIRESWNNKGCRCSRGTIRSAHSAIRARSLRLLLSRIPLTQQPRTMTLTTLASSEPAYRPWPTTLVWADLTALGLPCLRPRERGLQARSNLRDFATSNSPVRIFTMAAKRRSNK